MKPPRCPPRHFPLRAALRCVRGARRPNRISALVPAFPSRWIRACGVAETPTACSCSTQQIWTARQHCGPFHLGLWFINQRWTPPPRKVWATAHTTQFTHPGMAYLPHGRGAGALHGGGTYVRKEALFSPLLLTSPFAFRAWSRDLPILPRSRSMTRPPARLATAYSCNPYGESLMQL